MASVDGESDGDKPPFKDFDPNGAGAGFLRADLHMHSYGVSADVTDAEMTVGNIISTAQARALNVIAIADHNAIDSVKELLEKAPAAGLTAFPAVEVTTGEGHVLAYFPPDQYEAFAKWFGRLEFEEDQSGDRHTLVPIRDLLTQVESAGGLAIPAHIGRDNTGFLARVSPQIEEAIVTSSALVAVEVDRPSEAAWYSPADSGEGSQRRDELLQRRTAALGEVLGPRIAKVLFSDAHELAFVGRDRDGMDRVTRIKMSEPTFDAFRTALADPDARIKLEADLPPSYPRIVGARFIGGFLDGQEIVFSPNLTCLIGGRGTGKSTAIESARCTCLSSTSTIEGQPNCPETVQLVYRDEFGQDHYLKRDASKSTYELADQGAIETSVVIEGYDQDRIAAIIRGYREDPRLLLTFLDQFAEVDEPTVRLNSLAGELGQNAEEIRPLASAPAELKAQEKTLDETRLKLKAIEGSNLKEALEWRRRLQRERQVREELEARLQELSDDVDALNVVIDFEGMAESAEIEDLSKTPSAEILLGADGKSGLAGDLGSLDRTMGDWRAAGSKEITASRTRVTEALEKWQEREQAIEGRVQQILEELRGKGIKPNLAELNRLTTAETQTVRAIRELKGRVTKLGTLRDKRKKLLEDFRTAQTKRYHVRAQAMRKLTDQLNAAFAEFKVKLGFREAQLVDQYEAWVREALGGRFVRGPRVNNLCRSISPIALADLARRGDTRALLELRDDARNPYLADEDEAGGFIAALRQADLDALEEIALDDHPEISLTTQIDGKPTKVDFENLSFGQKASILLGALLFSSEQSPLIIDQPEDHLDSQFISRTVVSVLRRVKERRQVIIATHNANIAVLGDAEQIVPLQGYAGKGLVRDVGSVDAIATRRRACEILEGGEAAYKRRGEMYGFPMR